MTHRVVPHLGGVSVVTLVAALLLLASDSVNSASAASALLLAVVFAGRFWGTGPALTSAFLAAAALLYFFIAPIGFTVSDPNDWVSLIIFLITGLVSGSLLARHRQVLQQRDRFERLYWTEVGKSSGSQASSVSAAGHPDNRPG